MKFRMYAVVEIEADDAETAAILIRDRVEQLTPGLLNGLNLSVVPESEAFQAGEPAPRLTSAQRESVIDRLVEDMLDSIVNNEEYAKSVCLDGSQGYALVDNDALVAEFAQQFGESPWGYFEWAEPPYYVWADESCDNVTDCLTEALRWCMEFRAEGKDSYIVGADGEPITDTKLLYSASQVSFEIEGFVLTLDDSDGAKLGLGQIFAPFSEVASTGQLPDGTPVPRSVVEKAAIVWPEVSD